MARGEQREAATAMPRGAEKDFRMVVGKGGVDEAEKMVKAAEEAAGVVATARLREVARGWLREAATAKPMVVEMAEGSDCVVVSLWRGRVCGQ